MRKAFKRKPCTTITHTYQKMEREPKQKTSHVKTFWDGTKDFWNFWTTELNKWLGGNNSELSNRNLHRTPFEDAKEAFFKHRPMNDWPDTWFTINEEMYMQNIQNCMRKKLYKISILKNGTI
jgi:hypothetical protein